MTTQPTQRVTETITAEIFDELSNLSVEQHHEVLTYARSLKEKVEGVSGESLLKYAGYFDNTSLEEMQRVIVEQD